MSIIKKLSDVLKEVFWIKTSSKKKSVKRTRAVSKKVKKPLKKAVKKAVKPAKIEKVPTVKSVKENKPEKSVKVVITAKAVKAPKAVSKKDQLDPNLVKVGEITHYFERINVCVVKITHGTVLIGDKLTMVGQKSKFVQKVWSMQIESLDVKVAKKGQLIGLKVDKAVAVGDVVYK